MQAGEMRVFVVDDEEPVRESLAFMLEGFGYQVETFAGGRDFLEQTDLSQPGCALLDSRMPEMRGQEVHQALTEAGSPLGVIFLTGHGDVPMAVEALKAGAVDFFQKPCEGVALDKAIRKAMAWSENTWQERQLQSALETLTQREYQVFQRVLMGEKNREISENLCVSLRTVEVHRASIMRKLNAVNVVDLIRRYADKVQIR